MRTHLLLEDTNLDDLFDNISARVKYTCFAVSSKLLALGANTGFINIFNINTHKQVQAILPEKNVGGVTLVEFAPDDRYIGYATSEGCIVIVDLSTHRPGKPLRLSQHHLGHTITSICWDGASTRLFSGDDIGNVAVTTVSHSKTLDVFHQQTFVILNLDSCVVQVDSAGDKLLVSTITRSYLCYTNKDGEFGNCFLHCQSTPLPLIYCARPGSRLWEVDYEGSVMCTRQLKEQLSVPPFPIISDSNMASITLPPLTPQPIKQSVIFPKLRPMGREFVYSFTQRGLYVINPQTGELVIWTDQLTDASDIKAHGNELFVFYSDTRRLRQVSLVTPEECLCALIRGDHWMSSCHIISYYDKVFGGESWMRGVLRETFEKLHSAVINNDILSQYSQTVERMYDKLKEYDEKSSKNRDCMHLHELGSKDHKIVVVNGGLDYHTRPRSRHYDSDSLSSGMSENYIIDDITKTSHESLIRHIQHRETPHSDDTSSLSDIWSTNHKPPHSDDTSSLSDISSTNHKSVSERTSPIHPSLYHRPNSVDGTYGLQRSKTQNVTSTHQRDSVHQQPTSTDDTIVLRQRPPTNIPPTDQHHPPIDDTTLLHQQQPTIDDYSVLSPGFMENFSISSLIDTVSSARQKIAQSDNNVSGNRLSKLLQNIKGRALSTSVESLASVPSLEVAEANRNSAHSNDMSTNSPNDTTDSRLDTTDATDVKSESFDKSVSQAVWDCEPMLQLTQSVYRLVRDYNIMFDKKATVDSLTMWLGHLHVAVRDYWKVVCRESVCYCGSDCHCFGQIIHSGNTVNHSNSFVEVTVNNISAVNSGSDVGGYTDCDNAKCNSVISNSCNENCDQIQRLDSENDASSCDSIDPHVQLSCELNKLGHSNPFQCSSNLEQDYTTTVRHLSDSSDTLERDNDSNINNCSEPSDILEKHNITNLQLPSESNAMLVDNKTNIQHSSQCSTTLEQGSNINLEHASVANVPLEQDNMTNHQHPCESSTTLENNPMNNFKKPCELSMTCNCKCTVHGVKLHDYCKSGSKRHFINPLPLSTNLHKIVVDLLDLCFQLRVHSDIIQTLHTKSDETIKQSDPDVVSFDADSPSVWSDVNLNSSIDSADCDIPYDDVILKQESINLSSYSDFVCDAFNESNAISDDEQLAMMLWVYFDWISLDTVEQCILSWNRDAYQTWFTLIQCVQDCLSLDSNDETKTKVSPPVTMPTSCENLALAIRHTRESIKTTDYQTTLSDLHPLHILYLSRALDLSPHEWLLPHITSMPPELSAQHNWLDNTELQHTVVEGILANIHSPHKLAQEEQVCILSTVVDHITHNNHQVSPILALCYKYRYWKGCIQLLGDTGDRAEVLWLVVLAGDINLLKDPPSAPKNVEEWQTFLQHRLLQDTQTQDTDTTILSWDEITRVLVDSVGCDEAITMMLALEPPPHVSSSVCASVITGSLLMHRKRCVVHNMLDKVNTYFWANKPTQPTLQRVLERLGGEGDITQCNIEQPNAHWGIAANLNSECPGCGIPISEVAVSITTNIQVCHCGQAYHAACLQLLGDCPLCM